MISKIRSKLQSIPIGVKASVSYTVCSIFQRCLSFITMPLFTRLLTTEQYGQYSVYQSWSGILMIFTTLNLAYGSFSTAMIKFENDRKGYVAAVQNVCLALNAIFLMVYFPFRLQWNQWFNLPTPLVLLMVAEIFAQFVMACWYAQRRFDFKYKHAIALTVANSILSPVLAYLFVINSQERGYARIFGYSVFPLIVGAVLFVLAIFAGKGGWKKEYWKYALSFNIPLIPYYLSQVIFNQSDRIMIDHICGTDKAGIYGVAYTLGTILLFVLNAINNSYVPWFYQKIRDGKGHENKSIATGIALLMAFMLLGVIALAPEVILLLAGRNYYEAAWVVPPVAMSVLLLFYSQLFINVEFYYEEKTLLVWGSIGSAVLNVVLNALLIPKFGFVAAGYTTWFSYIAFAVANYYTMAYLCRKRELSCDFYNLKELLGLFVVFSAVTFLALALYKQPIIRYCIIAGVLTGLVIAHKWAIDFVKRVVLRK